MTQVAEAVAGLPLSERQIERLKTAVAEATMNAMEHGNQYDPDKPVEIEVTASETATSTPDGGRPRSVQAVRVTITDPRGRPATKSRPAHQTWRPSWLGSSRRAAGVCSLSRIWSMR
jgi:anti-sigma regulatory factor (Ser/Thr protein kinase)